MKDIAISHSTDPYVSAYPWAPGAGFGVKYADPATKPTGTGRGVAFMETSYIPPIVVSSGRSPNQIRMISAGLI